MLLFLLAAAASQASKPDPLNPGEWITPDDYPVEASPVFAVSVEQPE